MLEELYDKSKKSLETILREKAYDEVKDALKEKGINIEDVSDEDIEVLVAEKVKLKENTIIIIANTKIMYFLSILE